MTRNLKVYYYRTESRSRCMYANKTITNPQIMLTGKWLRNLGFEIGDSITLNCEQGKIVIENKGIKSVNNTDSQTTLF